MPRNTDPARTTDTRGRDLADTGWVIPLIELAQNRGLDDSDAAALKSALLELKAIASPAYLNGGKALANLRAAELLLAQNLQTLGVDPTGIIVRRSRLADLMERVRRNAEPKPRNSGSRTRRSNPGANRQNTR
jgi:hypothetical protein